MTVIFFLFAMVAMLINITYWIAYDFIRPGTRMPLAANEIGEAAAFLLLASALSTAVPSDGMRRTKEMIGTVVFAAANVALWIGWSGEWIQDILAGVVLGYLLCVVVRSALQTDAFSRKEWIAILAGSALLIAAQAGTFFAPAPMDRILDLLGYCLLFAGLIWFMVKSFLSLQRGGDIKRSTALAFAAYAWGTCTIYMSAGAWYLAGTAMICVTLLLMLAAVKAGVMSV